MVTQRRFPRVLAALLGVIAISSDPGPARASIILAMGDNLQPGVIACLGMDGNCVYVPATTNPAMAFNGGVAGFLGDEYNAFEVAEDPNAASFKVRDLSLPDADKARLQRRVGMLQSLDQHQKKVEEAAPVVKARDTFYEKAHALITLPAAKKALRGLLAVEDE